MSKNKYTEKNAVKDTKSSEKEVAEAWHTSRDDAGLNELPDRTPGNDK